MWICVLLICSPVLLLRRWITTEATKNIGSSKGICAIWRYFSRYCNIERNFCGHSRNLSLLTSFRASELYLSVNFNDHPPVLIRARMQAHCLAQFVVERHVCREPLHEGAAYVAGSACVRHQHTPPFAMCRDSTSAYTPQRCLTRRWNPQDAAMMQEAQAVLDFLSPVEVVWHQKQAGIIPNPCRQQHQPPGKEHPNGRPQGESKPLYRERSITREKRFYWQLYESLAAYRMAVKRESENEDLSSETETLHPSTYDWIVGTRFDVAWARPLPSLRAFSSDVVWFDTKSW